MPSPSQQLSPKEVYHRLLQKLGDDIDQSYDCGNLGIVSLRNTHEGILVRLHGMSFESGKPTVVRSEFRIDEQGSIAGNISHDQLQAATPLVALTIIYSGIKEQSPEPKENPEVDRALAAMSILDKVSSLDRKEILLTSAFATIEGHVSTTGDNAVGGYLLDAPLTIVAVAHLLREGQLEEAEGLRNSQVKRKVIELVKNPGLLSDEESSGICALLGDVQISVLQVALSKGISEQRVLNALNTEVPELSEASYNTILAALGRG